MHSHLDLKKSHFDSRNHVPDVVAMHQKMSHEEGLFFAR
jgi:hypothetical protein